MKYRLFQTLAWLVLAVATVSAQVEGDQVLFLVDDSSSMSSPAFAPASGSSRWEVVQSNFPNWLGRLGSKTHVGAVSVGGDCGARPSINFPIGATPSQLLNALSSAHPQGDTNLNAVLQASPAMFDKNVNGAKHIVLFSDGENTCQPRGSTCDIARELHRQHGIQIDVVAWVTNPAMMDEFKCVSDVTGGQFTTPQNNSEWANIPLPVFEPWRYVVMALSVLMLLSASVIFYRHAYHILGWSTGFATAGAGLLLSLGSLIVYITLFARAGLIAAGLGLLVAAGILALAAGRSSKSINFGGRARVWPCLVILFLAVVPSASSASATNLPQQCKKLVQGPPRFHHILAIDASGSVTKDIEQMKTLLSCYGEMYTLPKEEITLIAFGLDERGSAKVLQSFTIPDTGSTQILNDLLEDLKIQNPRDTKTYFRRLADVLNEFLAGVRMEPVVLVVSDGISDGYSDAEKGLVDFREVSFEGFGMRGIYSAPGMRNWRVAVQGGPGLDLTALFKQPLVPAEKTKPQTQALGSVIQPCLIDPHLIVETDNVLQLQPNPVPFWSDVKGNLALNVRNECATRFRSFNVELVIESKTFQIGEVTNTLVDGQPRQFNFDVSLPDIKDGARSAVVQIVLHQGTSIQRIYPRSPASITLERRGYLGVYGFAAGVISVGGLIVTGAVLHLRRRKVAKQQNRPEMVKVMGGYGTALNRNQPISIGGEGCEIAIPGVTPGVVLANAEWTGTRGELSIQPANGFEMRIRGVAVDGSNNYRIGQPLEFIDKNNGTTHIVTLIPANGKDMGFGSPLAASAGYASFDTSFSSLSDSIPRDSFGPSSAANQSNGSDTVDSYI